MSQEHLDRRSFCKLAAGTMALVTGPSAVQGANIPLSVKRSIAHHLGPDFSDLQGMFVIDPSVCWAMADDFGHYIHRMPIGVLFPRSVQDIQKTIRYANA